MAEERGDGIAPTPRADSNGDASEGTTNVMHIHNPRPARSVHEFLSEIGIIVVGIVIALSGEQLVERIQARHELSEARQALHAELGIDAANLRAILAQDKCADERLALLERWAEGKVKINSKHLASMNNRPLLFTLPITAWEVTTSGTVAAHMPIEERLAYAAVYDELANQRGHILDERRAWDLLARYAGKEMLTPEEASSLKADLGSVRVRDDDRRFNTPPILEAIARLGVKPVRTPPGHMLCGPPI